MKSIVFDSGPIISITMNNLLWILEPLKKKYSGNFLIPTAIKKELIDKPIESKRFKFEAIQVMREISVNNLSLIGGKEIEDKTQMLLKLANNIYSAKGQNMEILHTGEMQVIATAIIMESQAVVIDERTARLIIENPHSLKDHLQNKLHTQIDVNEDNLKKFKTEIKELKVIRSTELITLAFEIGLLDKYTSEKLQKNKINSKIQVLEGALWGAKLNGCTISVEEIEKLLKHETVGFTT